MELIDEERHDGAHTLLDALHDVLHGLLVVQLQLELVLHLLHGLVGLERNVGHVGVDHQREEVQDQVRMPSQMQERCSYHDTKFEEILRIHATHRVHHLAGHLHRRRPNLRIAAQNEAKVNVKQSARLRQQQIVEVPVADTQEISDHAVTSYRTFWLVSTELRNKIANLPQDLT